MADEMRPSSTVPGVASETDIRKSVASAGPVRPAGSRAGKDVTGLAFWKSLTIIFLICILVLLGVGVYRLTRWIDAEPAPEPAAAPTAPLSSVPPVDSPSAPAIPPEIPNLQPPVEAQPDLAVPDPVQGPAAEPAEDSPPLPTDSSSNASSFRAGNIFKDQDGVWRNRPVAEARLSPEFYRDEAGVWRNRTVAQTGRPDFFSNPLASGVLNYLGGAMGLSGEGSDKLGGLGALSDLGSLDSLGLLSGLGSLSGLTGSGDSSSTDAFKMFGELMKGNLFQTNSAGPPSFRLENPARPIQENSYPGLRLDGYEYFDPAVAGEISSEWEYFNGS